MWQRLCTSSSPPAGEEDPGHGRGVLGPPLGFFTEKTFPGEGICVDSIMTLLVYRNLEANLRQLLPAKLQMIMLISKILKWKKIHVFAYLPWSQNMSWLYLRSEAAEDRTRLRLIAAASEDGGAIPCGAA